MCKKINVIFPQNIQTVNLGFVEVKLLVCSRKYKMHRFAITLPCTIQNDIDILKCQKRRLATDVDNSEKLWYLYVRIPGYCIIQHSLLHKQRVICVKHLKQYALVFSKQMGCQHRLLELVNIICFRS